MKEDYITKQDYEAALKAKEKSSNPVYHTQICLIAQFAMRVTGKAVVGSSSSAACIEGDEHTKGEAFLFRVKGAEKAVWLFDQKKHEELLTILPLKVEWEYNCNVAT